MQTAHNIICLWLDSETPKCCRPAWCGQQEREALSLTWFWWRKEMRKCAAAPPANAPPRDGFSEQCHEKPVRDREGQQTRWPQSFFGATAFSDDTRRIFKIDSEGGRAGALSVISCHHVALVIVSSFHFSTWLLHLLWFAASVCIAHLCLGGFWAIRCNIQICNNLQSMSSSALDGRPGDCATSCQGTPTVCAAAYIPIWAPSWYSKSDFTSLNPKTVLAFKHNDGQENSQQGSSPEVATLPWSKSGK